MITRPGRPVAKTLLYCKICHKDTPHEIPQTYGAQTANCVSCMERSVIYELERE